MSLLLSTMLSNFPQVVPTTPESGLAGRSRNFRSPPLSNNRALHQGTTALTTGTPNVAPYDPPTRRTFSRRAFLGAAAAAATSGLAPRWASAQDRSVVVLARRRGLESILDTFNYQKILDLLTDALIELSGDSSPVGARRHYFSFSDHVAVQIATSPVGVTPEVVDAVITTAGRAGIPQERVFIYSADERELYRAGFAIEREGPGIRCFGARSERYQGSMTRLLLPEVTALASVSRLSPHPEVGLAGALHNFVNSVTLDRQREAYADGGARLPVLATKHTFTSRMRLYVMDCVRPVYDLPEGDKPQRWEYDGLLVSTDPVAIDAVGASLLQAKRREVAGREWPLDPSPTHIELAATRWDLGTSDLDKIEMRRVGPMDDALI